MASQESFERALCWLEECHLSHPKCRQLESGTLPTRVIDVRLGTSEEPKLRVSRPNETGRYLALSYCWGGDQHIKAIVRTWKRWTRALPYADLSRSIRDAIAVARHVGIPFLWVDPLCIVQDDPQDRAEEMAKMPQIYKAAYCTISAASARACHRGFLQAREPSQNRRHMLGLPYLCPDGTRGRVYVCRQEAHRREQEPIHSRAWTLQEQLLSCRLMTYGSWQLRWSCKTKELCDGGSSHSYYNYLEDLSSRLYSTPLTTLYPDSSARGFLVPSTESDGYGQYKSMILRPNGILLTQEFGTGNFRRRGYFDFRWESKIYSEHYDAGIQGFQKQRDNFRKEVFEGCPLSIITIM